MGSSNTARAKDLRSGKGKVQGAVASPETVSPRVDVYQEVTGRIIAELEAGRFPWVQPWKAGGAVAPGMPRNAFTGRAYSGINALILWATVIERGYPLAFVAGCIAIRRGAASMLIHRF